MAGTSHEVGDDSRCEGRGTGNVEQDVVSSGSEYVARENNVSFHRLNDALLRVRDVDVVGDDPAVCAPKGKSVAYEVVRDDVLVGIHGAELCRHEVNLL